MAISPTRPLAPRLAFFAMLAAAIALLGMAKAGDGVIERLRGAIVDTMTPVLEVVSRPAEAVTESRIAVANLIDLHADNARLRDENAKLLQWQDVARRLENENASLRHLLNATEDNAYAFVSARVIGDSGGAFARTMLLNVGTRDGVRKGQGVISALGLMGRIAEVGEKSSRALLLTDLNSRLPVQLDGSRQRAILGGDNSSQPILQYLPFDATPAVGERVVTSGDGGLLPVGLPVGVVSASEGGEIRVRLNESFDRLEFVRVLAFEPVALTPEAARKKPAPAGRIPQPAVKPESQAIPEALPEALTTDSGIAGQP
jgi:rod shape-determining protein MreC